MLNKRNYLLKIALRTALELIRIYCWTRQTKNRERLLAGLFIIPAILLLIPSHSFEITLFQSFLFQAMLAYGFFSIVWILKSHYRIAGTNFVIYLLLLMKINAPLEHDVSVPEGDKELTVLQFNLLATNTSYEETIQEIIQLNPDLLSFQEVSSEWKFALESTLAEHYPYYNITLESGQGVAIFSKNPLANVEVLSWNNSPNITGQIRIDEKEVNFVCLHTRSPTTRRRWQTRNNHLESVQKHVTDKKGEFLVLGDFNTVPWDKRLNNFRASTDLKDSRKRLTPTYPTWNPFFAQIPIDYIFHSEGIGCDDLSSVRITSDHKAMLGTFIIGSF